MPFKGIAGHSGPLATLNRILGSGRIAHAYLFAGPDGIGKKMVATAFIEALFCVKNNGCGECFSCRKIISGNHPDIHLLEPDGQFIKVDQIRALQKDLSLRPYEAPRKACILNGADRFNQSSANSLLKTLEEPPGNALMVLLATNIEAVMPTIRSRCQQLSFSGVPLDEICAFLESNGIDPDTARVTASLSEGSIARALSLCNDEILAERTNIITKACGLSLKNMIELFSFGELFDKDRERSLQSLDILTSFWRDMLQLSSGSDEIVNRDLAAVLERETPRRTRESLLRGIESLSNTRQAILRNVNVRLSMDILSMQLAI